jgi:hypothetical protein
VRPSVLPGVLGVVVGAVLVCAGVQRAAVAAPVVLTAPTAGAVVARADPPEDPYAAGRRAAVLASVPEGAAVLAPADGTVRWAGPVAGVRYVTVDHGDGFVTTVGRVVGPLPAVGDRVRRGAPLARHDPAATADGPVGVSLSVRRDGRYVDPAPLLTGVRARLVTAPGCRRGTGC